MTAPLSGECFTESGSPIDADFDLAEPVERQRIGDALTELEELTGAPVRGFYCRSAPSTATRRLLREDGRCLYDSDRYVRMCQIFSVRPNRRMTPRGLQLRRRVAVLRHCEPRR